MRLSSARLRGFSLPELLAVLAILGTLFAISVPALGELSAQLTLRSASAQVATIFNEARGRALTHRTDVGVKWVNSGGDVVFAIYEDGNGNGVLSVDIRSGVDRLVSGPISMKRRYHDIEFAFLPGFSGPDPGGSPIGNLGDPIRFGRSDICTFSPVGKCSPGSVYLSDRRRRQACVRLSPSSSRIQIFEWQAGTRAWIKRW